MQPMGTMMDWLPIETKPPLTHVEERGEYRTDDGTLWYFKPTHWRPLSRRKALDALTEHDQALGLYEQNARDEDEAAQMMDNGRNTGGRI
jgi:hypothetical protein